MSRDLIRNFCIIAHVDHGKSTLADRMLQITGTVSDREMVEQVLDSMDLEREKGVTIKASAVRMKYLFEGIEYELNLIDTPGHVDFNYEVSRALEACEGALLVVDATQGIEAQTLANLYLAIESNLTIIPVINKIDLIDAEKLEALRARAAKDKREVYFISALTGEGVEDVAQAMWRLFDDLGNHDPLVRFKEHPNLVAEDLDEEAPGSDAADDEDFSGIEVIWTRE